MLAECGGARLANQPARLASLDLNAEKTKHFKANQGLDQKPSEHHCENQKQQENEDSQRDGQLHRSASGASKLAKWAGRAGARDGQFHLSSQQYCKDKGR